MGNKNFEAIMGALVLLVAALFMVFAYQSSNLKTVEGYGLTAKFTTVSGVGLGTDIRIGGIKIGVVNHLDLDPETYQAVATFQIKSGIKLPVDSSAAVVSDGLLGSKYIKIEPGADEKFLVAGNTITHTQSSVNLEELIGKMAFGGSDKGNSKKEADKKPESPLGTHIE
ncbi:MAG: outer membrane lipid asymmetry maintenance protein MlaD [Pseudomonadota bacterium]